MQETHQNVANTSALPLTVVLSGSRLNSPVPILAVDIVDAAKLIGVSDDTIRREIDRGKLKGVKIGRVWRIRITELEAYLRRCEVRT